MRQVVRFAPRLDGPALALALALALFMALAAGAAEVKIVSTEPMSGFGTSVALGGVALTADFLVIGAPEGNHCGTNVGTWGRAEFYENVGGSWVMVHCDDPPRVDPTRTRASFGRSVAIYGDTAVVGEPGSWNGSFRGGKVHQYSRFVDVTGVHWIGEAGYSDSLGDSDFGRAVSMDGFRFIAGGPCDELYAAPGCVGDAWTSDGQLPMPTSATIDDFGAAVDIWGEYAIVGVPGDSLLGANAGSAYIYHRTGGWHVEKMLVAPDGGANHQFGTAVGISNDLAVVGSPGWGAGRGKLYFYRRSGADWLLVFPFVPAESEGIRRLGSAIYQHFGAVLASAPYSIVGTQEQAGKVLAFTWDNAASVWRYRGQRAASDSLPYLWWGDKGISFWQDKVAIGSRRDPEGGDYAGSVYILDATDVWGHIFSDGFERSTDRWSARVP